MNYFNTNQNLTVAFTFKTQKPDTICHITTIGTIFGTKDGKKIGVIYGLDMYQFIIIKLELIILIRHMRMDRHGLKIR